MKNVTLLLILTMGVLIAFTSCAREDEIIIETGNFSDSRDGQAYKWVKIGNQIWMAENLKFLPGVVGSAIYSDTVSYYYVYDYEGTDADAAKANANYQTYGALYNWTASLNACPPDWHLPTFEEWMQLINYIGKNPAAKLKARTEWYDNGNGQDDYGFTALPGGGCFQGNLPKFSLLGHYGNWWVVDEIEELRAGYVAMDAWGSNVGAGWGSKHNGLSVRCVKD